MTLAPRFDTSKGDSMSEQTPSSQNSMPQGEDLNPAEPSKTPLEMVKELQAVQQQNREVSEHRPDASPEVPGQGKPSDKRKHPQRQMYGSGTDES
jgi:hypothetical protein